MTTKKKSLGSWFPTASVIKNTSYKPDDKICICLFYQYVKPLWSDERKAAAITYIEKIAEKLNIGGRIRVGTEGLNATISSTPDKVREFTRKLGEFDEHFKSTDFKYMDDLPLDRAFKELKVLPVKELVYYGIHAEEELAEGGVHLEPQDYHKKLGENNTVVIDVRNAYESDIGRFGAQQQAGGAELLVPDMRKSTDFPSWIEREETKEKLQGKNVLMYCTGGVRCERASALLKSKYGESVAGVYQLQGGIEKYLQQFPDGGYWQGKNFVFDKREAIGAGCFEGVGGIVQSAKGEKGAKDKKTKGVLAADKGNGGSGGGDAAATAGEDKASTATAMAAQDVSGAQGAKDKTPTTTTTTTTLTTAVTSCAILGRCCACDAPWDRYIGKRKCIMCGVPVLLCVGCSSAKGMLDKQQQQQQGKGKEGDNTTTAAAATSTTKDKEGGKLSKRQRIKAIEAEKKRQKEEQYHQRLRVLRCPLCVAENVTVPADQVAFTANGTRAVFAYNDECEGGGGDYIEHSAPAQARSAVYKAAAASLSTAGAGALNKKIKFGDDDEDGVEGTTAVPKSTVSVTSASTTNGTTSAVGKAAPTVCKWGGGYSSREEKGKSAKKRKLNVTKSEEGEIVKISRKCKFGSECSRADCWFQH